MRELAGIAERKELRTVVHWVELRRADEEPRKTDGTRALRTVAAMHRTAAVEPRKKELDADVAWLALEPFRSSMLALEGTLVAVLARKVENLVAVGEESQAVDNRDVELMPVELDSLDSLADSDS